VRAYYFYIEETIEEHMLKTLMDKLMDQEEIVEGVDEKAQIAQILGKDERVDYELVLEQVAQRIMGEG
jgi:hypothetical protein